MFVSCFMTSREAIKQEFIEAHGCTTSKWWGKIARRRRSVACKVLVDSSLTQDHFAIKERPWTHFSKRARRLQASKLHDKCLRTYISIRRTIRIHTCIHIQYICIIHLYTEFVWICSVEWFAIFIWPKLRAPIDAQSPADKTWMFLWRSFPTRWHDMLWKVVSIFVPRHHDPGCCESCMPKLHGICF